MAPEILKCGKQVEVSPYTIYSDMYAYGVVLYELFAGEIPYKSQKFLAPGNTNSHQIIFLMIFRYSHIYGWLEST